MSPGSWTAWTSLTARGLYITSTPHNFQVIQVPLLISVCAREYRFMSSSGCDPIQRRLCLALRHAINQHSRAMEFIGSAPGFSLPIADFIMRTRKSAQVYYVKEKSCPLTAVSSIWKLQCSAPRIVVAVEKSVGAISTQQSSDRLGFGQEVLSMAHHPAFSCH